jgi:hypothetical protein
MLDLVVASVARVALNDRLGSALEEMVQAGKKRKKKE